VESTKELEEFVARLKSLSQGNTIDREVYVLQITN